MKRLSITLPGDTDVLQQIRDFVNDYTQQMGFDEGPCAEIEMAVDEAATNIIRHGYLEDESIPPELRTIELEIGGGKKGIEIILRDHARNFDPNSLKAPDLEEHIAKRQTHGLGVFAMKQFLDSVEHQFIEGKGNEIIMRRML